MLQQGQVFKLISKDSEGDALWAYRLPVSCRW